MLKYFIYIVLFAAIVNAESFKTIEFSSNDNLKVTADLYAPNNDDAPFIIMFHRARWSRGEYRELAPKFNKDGYNCLAVDQRSGDEVNNVKNETNLRAKNEGLKADYLEAYKDMQAALDWVKKNYNPSGIIVWGSSYSSALVFRLAVENENVVGGVIAFSPGEYFKKLGQSEDYIRSFARNVKCPVFVTSAANEKELCQGIYNAVSHKNKIYFLPEKGGFHGSEALWERHNINTDYWNALNSFLKGYIKF